MSYELISLTRPLSLMNGVNGLFSRVLGGVQLPIFAQEYYPVALKNIREEIKTLEQASRRRFDFQNLEVVNAPRLKYLRMAELHYSMASRKPYGHSAMINISPLGWKSDVTGLPYLGVLEVKSRHPLMRRNPNSSLFSISVDVPWSGNEGPSVTYEPNIPQDMKELYFPTATALAKACGQGNTAFISTVFAGEMPLHLENYIHEVEDSGVFDSLWLIFEAPLWKIGRTVRVQKDPIVIGRKNHKILGPQYWFLGIFDPEKSSWARPVANNYVPGPQFLLNG